MPMIQPDLSETGSNLLEPGTYKAKINSADPGTSAAGNAKLVVKFSVDYNGKQVPRTAHVPVSGKGAFVFENLLRACGFDDYANALKRKEAGPFNSDDLVGQELQVRIDHEERDGNTQDRIQGYLKP